MTNVNPFSLGWIQRHYRLIVLLTAGSLAVMPGAVIAPVLPQIVQQLALSKTLAGYLVSAHYLTVALCSPVLGILADRLGRTRVLIGSLLAFSIAGIAGAWTTSFLPMLTTRALLGAATGGIAAASLGLLAQMYPDEQARSRAIAYASTALTLANIVYPLMSGWTGAQNWRSAFYLYGLGVPLALLALLFLREGKVAPRAAKAAQQKNLAQVLLRQPQVLRLLLTLGITAATAFAAVIYLPLHLTTTLGTSTIDNALVLASQAIGAALSSALVVSRLHRRFGIVAAIPLGLGLLALAAVLIPQAQAYSLFIPLAFLFGAGLGIAVPSHYAALATLAPLELQSSILAIATGTNFLGQFLSPTLYGVVIQQSGVVSVFYAAAIVALIMGGFWVLMSRSKSDIPVK
ncbi:MFS transporter [Leptolyngbya sp. FACHB-711]|uniref:MFS transporter n=1 Tax=unclassified Leptolyngbya TaxID=2650499 RepID=UPI0018EFB7B1|nr:MFS transporter [Leptolyngbya sp. FACHB-711]